MAYETTDQLIAEISDHWVKDPRGNMYKLLDTYNTGFEQISDMADKVERWRAIQDAEGTTLDLFGQDINTSRPTKEDDPYRFLIKLKVLLSRAQGTIPSIVHITSTALGTDKGIKIWHTAAPRHIGIRLPWDYVNDDYIQRFLVNNLQHMLALGYWLDCIVFDAATHVHGYLGAGTTDRWEEQDHLNSTWWTGWRENTDKGSYLATAITDNTNDIEKQDSNWGNSWSAKTAVTNYVATVAMTSEQYIQNLSAVWWTPGKDLETSTGVTFGTQTIINDVQSLDS